MTKPVDFLGAFATGVAQLIAADGIAEWNPDGTYTADQVGITISAMPTEPDQIVSLLPYTVSSETNTDDSVLGLRVLLRGTTDPRSVLQRLDRIFDLLQNLQKVDFEDCHIVVMWQQSSLPAVPDSNQRWEISAVFYARANLPTRHRPD